MPKKKVTELQKAQKKTEDALREVNRKIDKLGSKTGQLYEALNAIQAQFDTIRNIPEEEIIKYKELESIRSNWIEKAQKIEKEYELASKKVAGAGVAGAGVGVAVVAMGPTVAMGVATTFGVASTGTAIATLSGAAATNAALAWLGGGALAFGGGGMAAGEALLGLAGPIGWTIAGVALIGSGLLFFANKSNKEKLERIFIAISKRDVKSYKLATVELNERIERIIDESNKLREEIDRIKTFGTNYDEMTDAQKYELGAYVNLMNSSTALLVNPIMGLQPNFNEEDFDRFVDSPFRRIRPSSCRTWKHIITSLANLLYEVEVNSKERKLLWKTLKNNKDFLKSCKITKEDFTLDLVETSVDALRCKRKYKGSSI